MAPDERTFEKALARHLRSSSEPASPQRPDCADAETLAAYHERLLAPSELNSWKEHIAGCARCQEILAQLEATDEIPFASAGEQLADSRVLVMQPREAQSAPSAPAPVSSAPAKMPAPSQAPAKPRHMSLATWRWVAPAGALAAGLLVWVVWHEDRLNESQLQKSVLQPSSPTSVAENRPKAPASAHGDELDSVATEATKPRLDSKSTAALGRLAGSNAAKVAAPAAPAPAPATRANELEFDQAVSSDLRKADTSRARESFRAQGGAGASNQVLQRQSPALDDQARQAANADQDVAAFTATDKLAAVPSSSAPPPSRAVPMEGAMKKKEREERKDLAPGVAGQTETVVVNGEAGAVVSTSAANLVATGGPRIFPVPGTKVIWKIDTDGHVRRTANLGDSWQLQDVGVNATLLSGSAPSEKVCWLVGTFGTVLLTTDGGAHWNKRPLPVNAPVDRIDSTDAQHAVVTLQSTKIQFETFDAGQTWSLVTKK